MPELGIVCLEPAVEAHAVFRCLNLYGLHARHQSTVLMSQSPAKSAAMDKPTEPAA